jgi:hypothetical protein
MNRVIFQIGLLAFCVAVVYFGTSGMGVVDMVARGFIVFMAVVSGLALISFVLATALTRKPPRNERQEAPHHPHTPEVRETAAPPEATAQTP